MVYNSGEKMNAFDELVGNFSRLPSVGKKSAIRMVNWLLKQDSTFVKHFAKNISEIQEKIKTCSICGNWSETEPCPICTNPLRTTSQICVVEQPQDIATIEAYGEYKGTYHVLGGLIKPLEGIGPSQLSISKLLNRIKDGNISEIIIATNPTVEGDTTALYVHKAINDLEISQKPKITRLATGIPVGGDLEYIDKRTLALSFKGRSEF